MFSTLRQGSTVYLIEKTRDKLICKTVQVTSVNNPQFNLGNYNNGQFNGTVNITLNDNGNNREFGGLLTNECVVRYNNGSTIIAETRDVAIAEVDNIVRNSETALAEETINFHKCMIKDGKEVLASFSPQFAKEQALDKEVKNLHGRVDAMDGKLDKLLAIMSGGGTKIN